MNFHQPHLCHFNISHFHEISCMKLLGHFFHHISWTFMKIHELFQLGYFYWFSHAVKRHNLKTALIALFACALVQITLKVFYLQFQTWKTNFIDINKNENERQKRLEAEQSEKVARAWISVMQCNDISSMTWYRSNGIFLCVTAQLVSNFTVYTLRKDSSLHC